MPSFSVGQKITTTTPTIVVDAGLPVGGHQFQLEVIDSAGNRSRPDVAVVTVQRLVVVNPIDTRPTTPVTGPAITGPVVRPTGGLSPTVIPRSPAPKPRSKRSKLK